MTGGPTLHIVIECPQTNVGRVIGSSGATIKELQSRTGAKIQIDQNFPEGEEDWYASIRNLQGMISYFTCQEKNPYQIEIKIRQAYQEK